MIAFNCPKCGKTFSVKDEFAGRKTKCPKDGTALRVPAATGPIVGAAPEVPVVAMASTRQAPTTMKCPLCAEEIQKEAKKCRYCGTLLSEAVKQGYPAFYESVAKSGLEFDSILYDYCDYLFPDDAWLGSGLDSGLPFDWLIDERGDAEKVARFYETCSKIMKALGKRLEIIPAESQEALALRAMRNWLRIMRSFASPRDDPFEDAERLTNYIGYINKLKQDLSPINLDFRSELVTQLDYATTTCQIQLRRLTK